MSALLTADIHLNDKEEDAHRWALLPWLRDEADRRKLRSVLILGDLTVNKDRHPSHVVNRIVRGFREIAEVATLIVLRGNHDAIDPDHPFFQFIGGYKNIYYIPTPTMDNVQLPSYTGTFQQRREQKRNNKPGVSSAICMFLPATRDYKADWKDLDFELPEVIFAHATFDGAIAENGIALQGIPTSVFGDSRAKVWAGDVHMPQRVTKRIEYVGAPYRCHWGDNYTPRVVMLGNDGQVSDLHFPCKSKHLSTIRDSNDLAKQEKAAHVAAGDQVKVKVLLRRSEFVDWPDLREFVRSYAQDHDWDLFGVHLSTIPEKQVADGVPAPGSITRLPRQEVVRRYVRKRDLPRSLERLGLTFLEGD